jgi:hypothetical protein
MKNMVQVEFNTKNENQFYGMQNTLSIYQHASKGGHISRAMLEGAWKEAKTIDQKAVVLSVLFFIGDVVGRQHNLFEGKIDAGGNSQREVFRDDIIPFLVSRVDKLSTAVKLNLIGLITEYTTLDNVVAVRVKTQKKTTKVVGVIDMVSVFGVGVVAEYIAFIIRSGSPFQKVCVAKFVTRPRFSKRPKAKKMLEETKQVMAVRADLLTKVSESANLHFTNKGNYIDFDGFYAWRKEFNQTFESVLFSTQSIKDLDKEQFIELINNMPSDARFRVRNRVLFNEKWVALKPWFLEWEKYKEDKQTEQRKLEVKLENGGATEADKAKLTKVKKEAKVTTGAISFDGMFKGIVNGTIDKVKVQPFLDKINLPYNNLVIMDDSGSMKGSWYHAHPDFKPYQFAAFLATIFLTKNPDEDARNLIGLFSNECRLYNGISSKSTAPNSILRGRTVATPTQPLINAEDHFLDNQRRMANWLGSACMNGATHISRIPDSIHQWTQGDSAKIEELAKYPVWTLISDGEFNNMHSPEASMNDFMARCLKYFGFKPFIILVDVNQGVPNVTRFSGIDNLMVVPPNPASIEMLLTNFKDMDTFDVYTPLLSLSRSNRYAPIRQFAGSFYTVKSVKAELMDEATIK